WGTAHDRRGGCLARMDTARAYGILTFAEVPSAAEGSPDVLACPVRVLQASRQGRRPRMSRNLLDTLDAALALATRRRGSIVAGYLLPRDRPDPAPDRRTGAGPGLPNRRGR